MKELFAYDNITKNGKLDHGKVANIIVKNYNIGVTCLDGKKKVLFIANEKNNLMHIVDFKKFICWNIRDTNKGKFTTPEVNNIVTNKLFAEIILKCKYVQRLEFMEKYYGLIDFKKDLKNIDTKPLMQYILKNPYKKSIYLEKYKYLDDII